MSLLVKLNDVNVSFKPGVFIKEKLSEDLDTGFLIVYSATALTVEPMDQVKIYDTSISFTKKMLVSDIKRKTSKLKGTKKYTYELGLVSPTIQLQRIVLPNRSITQPLTGTKTDIYTVLSQYVGMYSDFTMSSALQTLTEDVDCPEFQWNRPTLFEVLNDLLSEVDACITFHPSSFTMLYYLDLNTTGSEIAGNFNEIELTQSITDYADKVEAEIENAVANYQTGSTIEWVALKTTQDSIVTTDNAELILEKPIYKINKVTAKIKPDIVGTDVYEADITDWIVEKRLYDLYYPSNSTSWVQSVVSGGSENYKRDALYYEEGSNKIEGFCFNEDTLLSISSKKAINNVFRNAYLAQESTDIGASLNNTDVLRYAFIVDYQAIETVKFISNKENALAHSSTLINNQDTSYTDLGAFTRKQNFTANRLGNQILTYTGRCDSYSDIAELGDYEDDFKVAEREFSIYKDYCVFKLTCAENYVLKDLFTALKAERRYTKIASDSEAFECNHITELNFNFSSTSATTAATLENYLFSMGWHLGRIDVALFETNVSDPLAVAPSTYYTNKSLILTYRMADNFSAGVSIDTAVGWTGLLLGVNNAAYVNSTGNYAYHSIKLYKTLTNAYMNQASISAADWLTGLAEIREYPFVDTADLSGSIYSETGIYRYKDNREITVETIQFNFTADEDIFIGNKFFSDSPMIHASSTQTPLYVAYSDTLTYSKGDQVAKGTIADAAHLTFTPANHYITISSPDSSITIDDLVSWAICDAAGNIYVARNGNGTRIYLNKEA